MKFNYWHKFEYNSFYHLYNRSINNEMIFFSGTDCNRFLKSIDRYFSGVVDIVAYCLIPNHFHLLVKSKICFNEVSQNITGSKSKIQEKFMKEDLDYNDLIIDQIRRIMRSYALFYNQKYSRTGSVFQKRTKRIKIHNNEDVIRKLIYIHHNPIHHKHCDQYESWNYSSYNSYFSKSTSLQINNDHLLSMIEDGSDFEKRQFLIAEHNKIKSNPNLLK